MMTRFAALRAGTLAGCMLFLLAAGASASEGVPVTVAEVEQQAIKRRIQLTGTVTSLRVAQLSPSTSGLVSELYADVGDRVEADEVLVRLDPELARHQWESARAEVAQAESEVADARRRLQEAERLGSRQGIAETQIRDLEAEVARDQATLEQTRADAAYRRAVLERHKLRAPFAGVVSRKLTEQGEWISPGEGAFELVATEKLRLDFEVAEDYLTDLRPDTDVQFRIGALPDRSFRGEVKTVVPVTDPGARTFLLRVVPKQSDPRLLPGMSVNATLQIPTDRSGIVVPRDAVLRHPDGRTVVWTVESGDDGPVAREQVVTPGQTFDGLMEIREGLASDARVVVRGNETLQDGQRVRLTERKAENR